MKSKSWIGALPVDVFLQILDSLPDGRVIPSFDTDIWGGGKKSPSKMVPGKVKENMGHPRRLDAWVISSAGVCKAWRSLIQSEQGFWSIKLILATSVWKIPKNLQNAVIDEHVCWLEDSRLCDIDIEISDYSMRLQSFMRLILPYASQWRNFSVYQSGSVPDYLFDTFSGESSLPNLCTVTALPRLKSLLIVVGGRNSFFNPNGGQDIIRKYWSQLRPRMPLLETLVCHAYLESDGPPISEDKTDQGDVDALMPSLRELGSCDRLPILLPYLSRLNSSSQRILAIRVEPSGSYDIPHSLSFPTVTHLILHIAGITTPRPDSYLLAMLNCPTLERLELGYYGNLNDRTPLFSTERILMPNLIHLGFTGAFWYAYKVLPYLSVPRLKHINLILNFGNWQYGWHKFWSSCFGSLDSTSSISFKWRADSAEERFRYDEFERLLIPLSIRHTPDGSWPDDPQSLVEDPASGAIPFPSLFDIKIDFSDYDMRAKPRKIAAYCNSCIGMRRNMGVPLRSFQLEINGHNEDSLLLDGLEGTPESWNPFDIPRYSKIHR